MKNLILPHNIKKFRHWLIQTKPLIGFDFDGTLVPIAANPHAVKLSKATQALLNQLNKKYHCVAITGRGAGDLKKYLGNIANLPIVGNHGIEGTATLNQVLQFKARVQGWLAKIEAVLTSFPGAVIENKKLSLSIHFRHAQSPRGVQLAMLQLANRLPGCAVIMGKDVVNLVPRGAPNKGTALKAMMKRLGQRHAFYVGDDVTDEYVFAVAQVPKSGIWGVRVEKSRISKAEYFVSTQKDVNRLLKIMVDAF